MFHHELRVYMISESVRPQYPNLNMEIVFSRNFAFPITTHTYKSKKKKRKLPVAKLALSDECFNLGDSLGFSEISVHPHVEQLISDPGGLYL